MAIAVGQKGRASDFISTSAGAADAGKVPKLGGDGKLDSSFLNPTLIHPMVAGEALAIRDAVRVGTGTEVTNDIVQTASTTTVAVSGTTRIAQTFVIGSGMTALNTVYNYSDSINTSPAGAWEVRTGHVIGAGTLIGSGTFGGAATPHTLTMTFASYPVSPGDQFHYIVWMTSGFMDARGHTTSQYGGGAAYISTNSGGSWALHGTIADWKFGTAGATTVAGRLYKATSATKDDFLGFMAEAATAGQTKKAQIGGVIGGFTGLTVGGDYYIDNTTAGAITTATTTGKKVGLAISPTELLIKQT
jgi:hypothetical protein